MELIETRRRILLSAPHVEATTPTGVANFTTDLISPLKSLKAGFLPVQSGSGDPSPSNVRPISGWSGLTVTKCGKNLLNPSMCTLSTYWRSDGYRPKDDTGNWLSTNIIPVLPGETYSILGSSVTTPGPTAQHIFFDVSGQNIVTTIPAGITNQTFIVPAGCYYVCLSIKSTSTNGVQFELGSTATSYETYTGTALPVSWQSTVGTIYGGYVDLISGLLIQTHNGVEYDGSNDENWALGGDNNFVCKQSDVLNTSRTITPICNKFVMQNPYTAAYALRPLGSKDYASTVSEWRTWLSSHPIFIVYQRLTPTGYQLTPSQLKSLKGTNNIWSNANGNINIQYWKH